MDNFNKKLQLLEAAESFSMLLKEISTLSAYGYQVRLDTFNKGTQHLFNGALGDYSYILTCIGEGEQAVGVKINFSPEDEPMMLNVKILGDIQ